MSVGEYETALRTQYIDARRRLTAPPRPQVQLPAPVAVVPILMAREVWPSQPAAAPYDYCIPKLKNAHSIIAEVAKAHQLTPAILVGRSRTVRVSAARHEAAFRIVMELGYSYPKTGRMLGGRDHTTILNSIQKHAKASPEAGEQYRRHVECEDGVRQRKKASALVMYFDEGLPSWKIAARLHLSAGAVNRWLLEETERRNGNKRAA